MRHYPVGRYLVDGFTASAQSGTAMDSRNTNNYHFIVHSAVGGSALVHLMVSHDNGFYFTAQTYTATTTPASAQITNAYYPYVRGLMTTRWSNATAWLHETPGTV